MGFIGFNGLALAVKNAWAIHRNRIGFMACAHQSIKFALIMLAHVRGHHKQQRTATTLTAYAGAWLIGKTVTHGRP